MLGLGRSRRTVGVDVGSSRLKVAVVDHSRGTPRLQKAGVCSLDDGGGSRGRGRVERAIRSLFEAERLPRRGVVCGVGGRDVIVKLVHVDRAWEERSREAIRRRVSREVSLDPTTVETDVHLVDAGGDSTRMAVLLVAARRQVVADRIGLLEAAGLAPGVVDAEALALHNCVAFNHPEATSGVVALACVGHRRTVLSVADDGTPVLVRDLPLGTGDLHRRVCEEHGMSGRLASDVLRGRIRPLSRPVARTIRRGARELAEAVERTSAFLEEGGSAAGVGSLYVSGGGAHLPHLREVLADRLGVEVFTANPLQCLDSVPGALDVPDVEDALPLLVPAVGMGLRRPT